MSVEDIKVITPFIPLEDYFPTCILPTCDITHEHSHILPHQLEIMEYGISTHTADKCHLYCQGGVGSAKSVAFAARTVREMVEVPDNVGVVSRRDFKMLYKSSWLDVKKCIKKLVRLNRIPNPHYVDKRQGDYTTIEFPNGSVLYALQGKNWTEGLGASYGVYWCDDAMELPDVLFTGDETSAGLVSRLRLPEARFYVDKDGNACNRLIGLVSSNPPYYGHWLHKLYGKEPGIFNIGKDVVKHMVVETTDNPFVGEDYAIGLVAVQRKMGGTRQNVERVIKGKSTPAYGGRPVFPQFDHRVHVGSFKFDYKLPLVRGWDFGFHHPAVTFSMLYKCEYGVNHYITLSEVAECFSVNIWELYSVVNKHTEDRYSDASIILDGGDRAGYRKSDANKDRRGPIRILQDEYKLSFKYRQLDLNNSLEYMRSLLKPKPGKRCKCDMELILVDKSCSVLIGALEGGYKYGKKRDGTVSDKPVEDKFFADVACAWRYGAENFVKWGLPYVYIDQPEKSYDAHFNQKPWSWMDIPVSFRDKDFTKLLTN